MSGAPPFSWRDLPTGQRVALVIAVLSGVWTLIVLLAGGIDTTVLGIRVRSNEWFDPAIIVAVALALLVWQRRRRQTTGQPRRSIATEVTEWLRAPDNLLLIAILGVATVARFWALTFGFPHPSARPDEEAVSAMAGGYLHGSLEQTVFTYPPLFMLLVAATLWLVFRKAPAMLARMNVHVGLAEPSTSAVRLVARVLSAASGVISVWLLFRIGLRLFGRTTAFAAATCLALAFLHVRDSHFGVTDIPMTCMVLVGFLAIVKLSESGSRRDLVWAGVLTGLAVATKYNAALLVLPASFAVLNDPLRRPVPGRVARLAAFGAVMTATFLIVSPFSIVSYEKFLADVTDVSQHLSQGHGVDLGRGWTYHFTTTLRYGLGTPLLAAGSAGLVVMLWREGSRGILVALFPVAYYIVTGSGRTVFARYVLPAVPFLCLTAGYLIATVSAAMATWLRRPGWRIPATAMVTAAVLWPSIVSVIKFDRLIARDDSRVLVRRWIEARFAPGTPIAQLGPSNGHAYIYYETDYQVTDIASPVRPTLVVVASSPMGAPDLGVAPWLEHEYELQFQQQVVAEDDPANIYDRQDEFFVPLAGFHQIERPGPNLRVYVRRGATFSARK